MARIREWADLCELGDAASLIAAGWVASGGGAVVSAVNPFHDAAGNGGSYSLALVSSSGTLSWTSPAKATPTPTMYLRIHGYFDVGIGMTLIRWLGPTIVQGSLVVDASGHLLLYSGGTLLATSTNVIAAGTYYTIEVGITIGAVGSYELRVGGTSIGWIPPAAGNTKPGADTTIKYIQPYRENGTGGGTNYFDDIAPDDAVFPGESLITALAPNGVGTTTQLTPTGSVTNWQNVDERPPSDTDFNAAVAPNQEDTYAHAALPGAAFTVKNVVIAARVVRIGSTIASGYIVSRSGGADHEAAAQPVGISPSIITAQFENDPATSAPWIVSDLNSSEIGIRFDT